MVFVKILVLLVVIFLAIIIIMYRERIVRIVGKNQLAERYLGTGGTYTFWILFSLLLIVMALIWLVGVPGCDKT